MELVQMFAGAVEEFGRPISDGYAALQAVNLEAPLEFIDPSPMNLPPEPAGIEPLPVGLNFMGLAYQEELSPPWMAASELGFHQQVPAMTQTCYDLLSPENCQPLPNEPSHTGHGHLGKYPAPWTAAPELGFHHPAPAMAQTGFGPLAPENWPLTAGVHSSHPMQAGLNHMGLVDLPELPPPWMAAPELGLHQPAPATTQTYYGPLAFENWQLPPLMDRQTAAFNHGQFLPEWAFQQYEAIPHYPDFAAKPKNQAAKVARPVYVNQRPTRILANRKVENLRNTEQPYVKKPPNAFMLFMKERRPDVVAEYNITNNSDVNKILGKLWKSMTKGEQAPYYDRASEARRLHDEQNPDWSFKDNYGKKRKRERGKAAISFAASAPKNEF